MRRLVVLILSCLFLVFAHLGCNGCNDKKGSEASDNPSPVPTPNPPPVPKKEFAIDTEATGDISSANVASFTILGICLGEDQEVTVNAGGLTPTTQPICSNGAWEVTMDLTGLNKMTSIVVTAEQSLSNGNTYQDSETITNNFVCHEGFIGIPALKDFTTNSFCVAKYEMKNAGADTADDDTDDSTVSQASGLPIVSINKADALTKCQEIGEGYNMMINNEWQTIARNVEAVLSNWENQNNGIDEFTILAQGNMMGPARSDTVSILAAGPDSNPCFGIELLEGEECSDSIWHRHRRAHTLSNGEVIWDLGGNVTEWVRDNNDVRQVTDKEEHEGFYTHTFAGFAIQFYPGNAGTPRHLSLDGETSPAKTIQHLFFTANRYISSVGGNRDRREDIYYRGLGKVGLRKDNIPGSLTRGGSSGRNEGVFSVYMRNATDESNTIGFRCAYHP